MAADAALFPTVTAPPAEGEGALGGPAPSVFSVATERRRSGGCGPGGGQKGGSGV